MLIDHFFTIISLNRKGDRGMARLQLNRQSPIYSGHFPSMPVVPGVCSVRIIHELTERMVSKKLMMIRGDNIKFLGLINPDEAPEIEVEITLILLDDGDINVSSVIKDDGKILVKFTGCFR